MLNLFGLPMLTTPSGRRINLPPTGWRLVAALAAHPGRPGPLGHPGHAGPSARPAQDVTRADLADLVIPTSKLSTLRKLVWDVRKALDGTGLDLLEVQGGALRLSDDVSCDVRDLYASRPKRALREIYRGAFFEGEPSFEHRPWKAWLEARRRELRDLYVSRASDVLASQDVDRATKALEARHLLRHAPDHVEATRIMMFEGARASDAGEVRRRFSDFRSHLNRADGEPDRRTADFLHRLVGASQRRLGDDPAGVIGLPTVHIRLPPETGRSRQARLLRSLLVDMRIGLCRASLFRVVACEGDRSDARPSPTVPDGKSYALDSAIVDHILGPQTVFTLVSLPTQEIVWTERVDPAAEMSVAAYNLLIAGILRSLIQRIQDAEIQAFRTDTEPSSYASYLLGCSSLASLDLARLRKGRTHLRRSMSQTPDFAPTASALARSLQLEWLILGRGDTDLLGLSRRHSLQAIASDPFEPRGFKALGFCDLFSKRYDSALDHYEKAERLSRNNAEIVVEHANCLLHCGMIEQAIERLDYAKLLNPDVDDLHLWTRAAAYYLTSSYDAVLAIVGQMRDRVPAMRLLAATHAMRGDRAMAEECRKQTMQAYPTMTIDGWIDTVAMRDPGQVLHYAEGLARAGFRRTV